MRLFAQALLLTVFAAPAIASPADVLNANRDATAGPVWAGKQALVSEYAYSGQGLTGTIKSRADLRRGWWADDLELGPAALANGFDGAHAWAKDQSGTITVQDGGDQRALAVNEAYRRANLWWRDDRGGATIADAGEKQEGGQTYNVLTVTPRDGKQFDAWFDAHTHLLYRTVEQQGPQTVSATFSGYAPHDGVEFAGKGLISDGDAKYDQTVTLTKAYFLPTLPQGEYGPPRIHIADYAIAGGAHETSFPFQLINNHIYAEVSADGKGPFTFIFDTGGENILTPRTATALGLKSEGQLEGRGAGSGHMDMGLTKLAKLELGKASVKDQVFIVAPLDALEPAEGFDMSGMVGFQVFRRFVTRFDYGARTLTLIDPAAFDAKDAGVAIPFKFNGNTIEIQATYGGIPGNYTIDTGSRSSVTLSAPFAAAHDLYKGATAVDAVTGWGVGGPTRSRVLRGQTLALGPEAVQKPVVEVSTDKVGAMADPSIAGNIGAAILKRYVVTLDYGHQTMYLKPATGQVDDLDTFDRAGLWINQASNGFSVIDVTKDAPADQAGLKPGDVVLAVDGKPASSLKLYEVRKRLRDEAPGTVVKLTVRRGSEQKDLAVTLRDLI